MDAQTPNDDPMVIALAALAATLSDERRAQRFIELTGIGTDELRRGANDPILLAALIAFLEAHEPDLLSVSAEIGVKADALTEARRQLEREQGRA